MSHKLNPYDLFSGNRIGELRSGKNCDSKKIVGMNPYTGKSVKPGKIDKNIKIK